MAAKALTGACPGTTVETIVIRTQGDVDLTTRISDTQTVGFFVREIEAALHEKRIDLAVHSLKDLPTELPRGLALGGVLPRADRRDALVTREGKTLAQLPAGARVATGSFRRQALILGSRPDLLVVPVRGNVDTRIARLMAGDFEALLMACAALERLDGHDGVSRPLDEDEFVPAPCQGIVGLELRADDDQTREAAALVNHDPSLTEALAERAFLRRLGSGCSLPAGASARCKDATVHVKGFLATPDGTRTIRARRSGPHAPDVGNGLAEEILRQGGEDILGQFADRRSS
jgi:hydroxymethylbilane synthase